VPPARLSFCARWRRNGQSHFFVVGEHAKKRPDLVRRAYGKATRSTPIRKPCGLPAPAARRRNRIDDGIETVQAALGPAHDCRSVLPRLRVTSDVEQFLIRRELMLWSVDVDTEDWRPQSPKDLVERTLTLLQADARASHRPERN